MEPEVYPFYGFAYNVDSFEKGYFRACSTRCAAANPERTRKYEATMMKNYGSTNFFTSEAGKKK